MNDAEHEHDEELKEEFKKRVIADEAVVLPVEEPPTERLPIDMEEVEHEAEKYGGEND